MTFRPKAIDHMALKVTDMEQSLHFYHHVLGSDIQRQSEPNESGGKSACLQAVKNLTCSIPPISSLLTEKIQLVWIIFAS